MSPEIEAVLRHLVVELSALKRHYPNSNTRAAIEAMMVAITRTIVELKEPA